MALEVDFITLGDASSRLDVPAPTLRHWTDQMEEFNVHYVLRNNRNERIYEESDVKVFEILRDLKSEYGRRTTTRDLGYMIAEKGKAGDLQLRTREDAPQPEQPSNRTADLLNQEDIQRLMQSERVKQFINIIISETQNNLKGELREELTLTIREEIQKEIEEKMTEQQKALDATAERIEESLKKRDDQMTTFISEMREQNKRIEQEKKKGFFERLFGK
ncbi:TPA: MerR family transcriptional regulator [Bacillus cereus]|uniref:MerR family transcriptional regulator n=1 Tax=Bacillus paranthracis TaxID=2026186 RepID=UPI002D794102|nr:MerR family transcriptional regulator [Bacillus paranthracis]HDR8454005.1 MerR family transcriptional regulator [Bacillus cereus]